ncbi:biogenesis of lysosome-related organelles complex 1 subunit 5 [Pelomyxa schiedti]|nr:biogenesis of lysosome-related organelles complex 1 subunit 5 [Pelomyxa schiedti]
MSYYNVGSLEPLVRDCGSVFGLIADFGPFVENESKLVLDLFEQRYGDKMSYQLQSMEDITKSAVSLGPALPTAAGGLEVLASKVKETSQLVKSILENEKASEERRRTTRNRCAAAEAVEKKNVEAELASQRAVIDANFAEALTQLKKKYSS